MSGSDVSILIPVHNRVDLTRECLKSLWQTLTPSAPCEVLVYDDQSTDETRSYLHSLGDRVRVLAGTGRGCFGTNMNALARAACGKWLCLLNNDTVLKPDWLSALLRLASRRPRAGVIGNFHRFPQTGRVSHAGIVFDTDLTPRQLYLGMPDNRACTGLSRKFQCVSGACWLVRRDHFLDLGGFDSGYRNGFEDLDYCLRARDAGQEIWYCGESRIDHHGQSAPGRMAQDVDNHRLFLKRWKDRLIPDLHKYVGQDGQCWPPRSLTYRVLYQVWRNRLVRVLGRPLLRTRMGIRVRERVLSMLNS